MSQAPSIEKYRCLQASTSHRHLSMGRVRSQSMALQEIPVVRQRGECCALPAVDGDWAEQTATLMKALADPTRLTMISALWKAKSPVCICDFTADRQLSQATISHHMAKLKDAGL